MFVASIMVLATLAAGVVYSSIKLSIGVSIVIFVAAWILHFGSKSGN